FVGNFFTAVYQFGAKTIALSMPSHGPMHDWMGSNWAIPPFAQMLATILASPFLIPLGILIAAGVVHLFLLILGVGEGAYADTLKAECYSNGPLFLSIVPICGSVGGIIWALVILVIGLTVVHRISAGKALAAVVLPLLLCCACLSPIFFFAGLHHWM